MRKSRKTEIYETAMRLFRERSYDAVSVNDICSACGITKKAFYYHYASKEDLLSRYYQRICEDFDWASLREKEKQPGVSYPELLWTYEAYIIDHTQTLGTEMYNALIHYDNNHHLNIHSPFPEGTQKNATDQSEYIAMVARGQAAGQIRGDHTAQELLFVLFAAVIGVTSHWRSSGGAYEVKAEVRRIFDIILLPQQPAAGG